MEFLGKNPLNSFLKRLRKLFYRYQRLTNRLGIGTQRKTYKKKLQTGKNIISKIRYLGVELLELAAVIVEPEASLIIGALEHLFKGPGAFPGAPSTSIAEFDDDIREPFSYQHLTSILPSISVRLPTDL